MLARKAGVNHHLASRRVAVNRWLGKYRYVIITSLERLGPTDANASRLRTPFKWQRVIVGSKRTARKLTVRVTRSAIQFRNQRQDLFLHNLWG